MPKAKKMKNNASSARNECCHQQSEIIDCDENNELIAKHFQVRNQYLGPKGSNNVFSDSNGQIVYINENGPNSDSYTLDGSLIQMKTDQITGLNEPIQINRQIIRRQFILNGNIINIFSRTNFPARYPVKLENDESLTNLIISESNEEIQPIPTNLSKMTKSFIKFWNRIITKQDVSTSSVLDHQLTDKDAGYYPCQLKNLYNSPESYIKKPFCHRERYTGKGYQLLPSSNNFSKISARSLLKMEVTQLLQHYSEPNNQYYLIPIELSSKLSRTMLRSVEIAQLTNGTNKICFQCKPQNDLETAIHPILTIDYKPTVEQELMAPDNFSLTDNIPQNSPLSPSIKTAQIKLALFNYPYLSHLFHRNDFWCDDLFSRFWHYSRYFCDKLDLGNRLNNVAIISVKDSLLKYLLSTSARICIAIKFWVLNPCGASYFRCWCGQKIYDEVQENKLVNRFGVGNNSLYLHQEKIKTNPSFHEKHERRHGQTHVCPCGSQFKDHTSWISHAISPKIFDVNRICPIVIYNFAKSSQLENRFICECNTEFSDYDFWSFWLHICHCKTFKNSLKNQCSCQNKTSNLRSQTPKRATKLMKRRRSSSRILNKHKNKKSKSTKSQEDDKPVYNNKGDGLSPEDISKDQQSEEWSSCDSNIDLPLKVSTQVNSNQKFTKNF